MKIKKITAHLLLVALIIIAGLWTPTAAYAEHRRPAVNYGAYCRSQAGEVHKRLSIGEAIEAMRKNFRLKGLEVNNITYDRRFIRADLVDKSGQVVDSILLDSFTGRLRSVN